LRLVFTLQIDFDEDDTMLSFRHRKCTGSLAPHRRPGVKRQFVERLEERTLLTGDGLALSLVALGGATPRPIPLSVPTLLLDSADIGGPDSYLNFPGPATAAPIFGNENSAITDFVGVYGGAAVVGTGTDGQGNTGYWASDVRFMQGTYRGVDGQSHYGTFVEV
jgi:hypothetical protein